MNNSISERTKKKVEIDKKILIAIQTYFIEHGIECSDIGIFNGNYNDRGKLIQRGVPSFVTDLGEVGVYNRRPYLVVICKSKHFDQKLWLRLKRISNISIYGFKRFQGNFFRTGGDIIYKDILKLVQFEELFQVEKVFRIVERQMSAEITLDNLYLERVLGQYLEIQNGLSNKDIIVNQRSETLS